MLTFRTATIPAILASLACSACIAEPGAWEDEKTTGAFSSDQATLLELEFDASFTTTSSWNLRRTADDQMLYTIGHLNADEAVGRLDKIAITDLRSQDLGGGTIRVDYHVRLPVAWGSKTNLPTSYDLTLPMRMDWEGLNDFAARYSSRCVDWSAHDVDSGNFWYYYRPGRSGCSLVDADVYRTTATATVSSENTTGKYPEYDRVWADAALTVVAIFGKYEDGATSNSDGGIAAYNEFVRMIRAELGTAATTIPANLPSSPGVSVRDVTFQLARVDGRTVQVVALLVDNVRNTDAAFDQRYESLSADADMIFYNGHAGLGSNVRALARKGRFVPGKYQIFFMNGCDTFAYVDGALSTRVQNPDDPTGTKYLDMVTNAMPAFFSSIAGDSRALIRGLMGVDAPLTYDEIFAAGVDRSQVVVVTGEEDNTFEPGGGGGGGTGWEGLDASGTVARREEQRWEVPELEAGRYVFTMTGTGDADLYVRVGGAPTTSAYDCRPYTSSSNEECSLDLTSTATIHVMVRGYSSSSTFQLSGRGR